MKITLPEPEVTEVDLVVQCPVEGCEVRMSTPLNLVNREYEFRLRTQEERDEAERFLLQGHSQSNHEPRHNAGT
jgi:hypothetical protein